MRSRCLIPLFLPQECLKSWLPRDRPVEGGDKLIPGRGIKQERLLVRENLLRGRGGAVEDKGGDGFALNLSGVPDQRLLPGIRAEGKAPFLPLRSTNSLGGLRGFRRLDCHDRELYAYCAYGSTRMPGT